jgi:hypothetical protein
MKKVLTPQDMGGGGLNVDFPEQSIASGLTFARDVRTMFHSGASRRSGSIFDIVDQMIARWCPAMRGRGVPPAPVAAENDPVNFLYMGSLFRFAK